MNTPMVINRHSFQPVFQLVLKATFQPFRLFRWALTILSFLWCSPVPAQSPVWQPLWFSDLSAEMSVHFNNLNLNSLGRSPSSLNPPSTGRSESRSARRMSFSFLMTRPDQKRVRLNPSAYQQWLAQKPDPAQFTSYATTPYYISTPTLIYLGH